MVSVIAKLEDVISRHSQTLKCGAIISAFGEVTSRVGDFADFDQQGLASAVLGPYGNPVVTFQLAAQYEEDRKMLPREIGQGELFVLLDKPKTKFVVAVFGRRAAEFHEHLRHRREISATILELFALSDA
jgi:hypothetical protein